MNTVYYVDSEGRFIGGFAGSIPENATSVPSAPPDARMVWDGTEWTEPAALAATFLKDRRRAAYVKAGVTFEEMVVALWEKVMESRSTEANALQLKRQAVKEDLP